jgi:2,3-bisphosphoglycerate-independent phosphoglycerate mutase
MMNTKQPFALVILDGYGYRTESIGNAVSNAHKPTLDYLWNTYPHTILDAAGKAVGLLPGMIGNSEVGHYTIGSGRIVPQMVTHIHQAIDDGSFFTNPLLVNTLKTLPCNNKLHLIGLLSDAGVHSHIKHLIACIEAAHQANSRHIIIHPILDGRDTPPQSAAQYLALLSPYLDGTNTIIGSIHGRYYAMDRDRHWDRIEQSYRTLTESEPIMFTQWQEALDYYYRKNITDEFIPPTLLNKHAIVNDHDGIIFFNFRPDRARELTTAFVDPTFDHFARKKLSLSFFITLADYGINLPVTALYKQEPVHNTLKEVLNAAGKTMFSIAETEKYAHITYFFDGGKEKPYPHEERVLIPSIPVKNYIDHPAMSAHKITNAVLDSLAHDPRDFYLINYANADMVGHSGNFEATVKAVECLDSELKKLYEEIVVKNNGTLIITADHGNAEEKYDPQTGQPRTAHTTNPVPFIFIKKGLEHKASPLPQGSIATIAPFILGTMGIAIPVAMKRN